MVVIVPRSTACFEARTRRPISSSISAPICRMIHQNVANDVVYRRANLEADKTSASYLILRYNAEVGSCHIIWRAYKSPYFFGAQPPTRRAR